MGVFEVNLGVFKCLFCWSECLKPFKSPREYELVIMHRTCFSINFQVNIKTPVEEVEYYELILHVLSCSLHRCLHHAVNMNFASDKASFCEIQTLYMSS